MNETGLLVSGNGLSAQAANIALAVAEVLEVRCSPQSGSMEAAAFLREWSATTGLDRPAEVGPLDLLASRFGLTEDERNLILLAGLPEEHEGVATTFRTIHPQGEPRPTAGLAALLLGGGHEDRAAVRQMLSGGPLVRHGLLSLVGSGTFFEKSLALPDALWDALHGLDTWPAEPPRVWLGPPPPGLDGWLATEPVEAAVDVLRDDLDATVFVLSDDQAISLARAAALAAAAGRHAVAARVNAGDSSSIGLLAAQAGLRNALPVLVVPPPTEGAADRLSFGNVPGAIIVCASPGTVRAAPDRAVLVLPAGPIDAGSQQTAWAEAVPSLAPQASTLAARHPLDPAITAQLAVDVRAHRRPVGLADVSAFIRSRAASTLPPGVRLVTPAVPWSHVVLPSESGLQLRDAVARLDHQDLVLEHWGLRDRAHASRGARLLLTGPPGTGKSLAAAAVATAIQTDLLVVDVSQVVSKWLGETEKNLAAVFDAAERTQAVLLLDEADALFGTRTEISDAHDRYANLETAYLLQRIDRFDGLLILTSNLRSNIDPAFTRRMDYVVDFPLPNEAGRVELWTSHLPESGVDVDVDFEALARLYPVPGAWIRNAALAAAFASAGSGGRITQEHLVAAMRREYAKGSSPFPGEPPRRRNDPV